MSSSSGSVVKVSERASSSLCSAGQSPSPPSGHQAPASTPVDSGLRWVTGSSGVKSQVHC
jgi:hypothetical protein